MTITLNSKISKTTDQLITSKMDKELMAMFMDSGDYVHLNEIGTDIWALLDDIDTVEGLAEKLILEYDISKENCLIEIEKFINHLMDLKLVRIEQ